MDLSYTREQKEFRQQVREWLTQHVPAQRLASFDTEEGFRQHRQWEATLNEGRWGMVTWPEELGGRGCDLIEWLIFEEEYYRAAAPLRVNQNGIFLLGPTLMEYGTEEQKARILPKMATGEEVWAQGWSEPNAGSDMAAIRATAEMDGDHYVLNGQKTWSTRAVWADWAFCMFRTDPESQRWSVAMSTAGFERGLMLRSPARFQETARRLVELYKENRDSADNDPSVKEAVLRAYMDAESYCLSTYQTACRLTAGGKIGAESSTNKIFWSELDQNMHATAMSILGARAELLPHAPDASGVGTWLDGWLFSQSGPIYAGTNEIQRNIIAERMLGMPR